MYLDLSKLNEQKKTEVTDPATGKTVMVVYTKGGVVHRDDGPAAIHLDVDGNHWAQEWYVNGVIHRDDGPARMYLQHPMPTGEEAIAANGKHIAEWHIDGKYMYQAILDPTTFHQHWHKGDK